MSIDLNTIKCGCDHEDCLKGFRFDSNPDVILVQDVTGNDNLIYLSATNVNQLLTELKEIKKRNKW